MSISATITRCKLKSEGMNTVLVLTLAGREDFREGDMAVWTVPVLLYLPAALITTYSAGAYSLLTIINLIGSVEAVSLVRLMLQVRLRQFSCYIILQ